MTPNEKVERRAALPFAELRGRGKVSDVFTLAMLAVNLRRLPSLLATPAAMAGSG